MRVVVTGATGHLGRSAVHELALAGHEVVAVSRSGALPEMPYGASPAGARATPLALDLRRDDAVPTLADALTDGSALVHLAAFHPPSTASTGPSERRELLASNVYGTMRALEAARTAPGRLSVVVYSSSFEVYGAPGELPVTEQTRLEPLTDYGATKLSGEDHLMAFAFEDKTRVVALRMPAIYGAGERTSRALPNFLRSVARAEVPEIHGDGTDLRDQLHVRDAARGIVLALSPAASGIYNLADGEQHSVAELARLALRVGGLDAAPKSLARRKPRLDFHMSIERVRRELGFQPSVRLELGMAEELAWIREGSA